jgi:catechol-2,3-dioxygenase
VASVHRLNHAVLYVSDVERTVTFYRDVLGFTPVLQFPGAAFLRANGSSNDHDLGVFGIGVGETKPKGHHIGLYHLAWQVDTIDELAALRAELQRVGSLVGESDHGVSKSLYAVDPDGIEFEVMWAVPKASWPEGVGTLRLDLAGEIARWSGVSTLGELSASV